ncbi:MAG: hypothetical protein WBD20_25890 [Pirellulaceae bacterium]
MTNPYDPPAVVEGGVANVSSGGRESFSVLGFLVGFVASYMICGLGFWIWNRGMPRFGRIEAWVELSYDMLQLFVFGGVFSVPAILIYAGIRGLPGEKLRYRSTDRSILLVSAFCGGVAAVAGEVSVVGAKWISVLVLVAIGLAFLVTLLTILIESRFAEQISVQSPDENSIGPEGRSASLIWFSVIPLIIGGIVSLWDTGPQNGGFVNAVFGACFVCFIATGSHAFLCSFVCRGTLSTIGSRVTASITFTVMFAVPLLAANHYQLIASSIARVIIVLLVVPLVAGLASAAVDRSLSRSPT